MHRIALAPLLLLLVYTLGCSKSESSTSQAEKAMETPTKEPAQSPAANAKSLPVSYALSPAQAEQVYQSPLQTIAGESTTLASLQGKLLLVVNVASECGLTPQYEQLQKIHAKYQDRGFSVVGFPCNQFGEQEPGTPEEILAFGKEHFGVTFPLMQKVETNGDKRHPIYQALTQIKDAEGSAGDVKWNFEKFLLSADGKRVTRFRPQILPDDAELITLLESQLP